MLVKFANVLVLLAFTPICEKKPFFGHSGLSLNFMFFIPLEKQPFWQSSQMNLNISPKGTFANFLQ